MPTQVLPNLTALTPEQIEVIHARSLEILKRAGVRVDSPRARRLLADSQGVKWASEDRAFLEPALVEPPADLDMHMGRLNMRCQNCHLTVEHRIAGADANPYLVLAAVLAGLALLLLWCNKTTEGRRIP
mgnify:CR=1 FL=1